jgi:hypothetical protein
MPALNMCRVHGCVAEPVPGSALCEVHASYTLREPSSAVVYCYACGKRIDIWQRWVVRGEGAFHARTSCLSVSTDDYRIPLRHAVLER